MIAAKEDVSTTRSTEPALAQETIETLRADFERRLDQERRTATKGGGPARQGSKAALNRQPSGKAGGSNGKPQCCSPSSEVRAGTPCF